MVATFDRFLQKVNKIKLREFFRGNKKPLSPTPVYGFFRFLAQIEREVTGSDEKILKFFFMPYCFRDKVTLTMLNSKVEYINGKP